MFEQALLLALIAACYPPAMLAAVVFLVSARPGPLAAWYVAGGLLVVTIVGTAVLIAMRAGGLSQAGHEHTRYGLRLGLGVAALVAAFVIARRKPKPPGQPKAAKPGLMTRLSGRPTALTALATGVVVFGPGVTFIAAVQEVASAKASLAATIGAMAMIVVLTVSFAWLPLVAYLIAPGATVRRLGRANDWLHRNGKLVLVGALSIIGLLLVIQGIAGLA